jgi:hypothetical protein
MSGVIHTGNLTQGFTFDKCTNLEKPKCERKEPSSKPPSNNSLKKSEGFGLRYVHSNNLPPVHIFKFRTKPY